MARSIHLCGSVPLASATEVFESVASELGGRIARIPDGETGDRLDWLQCQSRYLRACPGLTEIVSESPYRGKQIQYRVKPGVDAATLDLGPLGYASTAIASYLEFTALKRAGRIPAATQFLVCLPTPLACVRVHIANESKVALEPRYEAAMRGEIAAMLTAIPATELAIQWDVAVEFSIIETRAAHFEDRVGGVIERLAARIDEIPIGVRAGIHLCYGDSGHKHFKEPEDSTKLVEVANGVIARVRRALDWIHLPVPRNRDDAAYFAPLRALKLRAGTELYLGLIHLTDGIEGAKRRIAAAQAAMSEFGVATECGFGRRDPQSITRLLKLHREVSEL